MKNLKGEFTMTVYIFDIENNNNISVSDVRRLSAVLSYI